MDPGTLRPWGAAVAGAEIRNAHLPDVPALAATLSEKDVAEIKACVGCGPVEGLQIMFCESDQAWSCIVDGRCVGMWGAQSQSGFAYVWLFVSQEVAKFPVSFSRIVREQLLLLKERWGMLYAYCDSDNPTHYRWLQFLGFEDVCVAESGPNNHKFVGFVLA